jgi:serine/threonine protein kinase
MSTRDLEGTVDRWSSIEGSEGLPAPRWSSDAPARVGRYVLLREIGRGAIGVVHAAWHEGLDRKVAIKLLNRQRAGRVDLEARLHREAQALAKLSHPNVVQVYDVGKVEGRVYVAMEFVEGQTLSDWMRGRHDQNARLALFVAAGRGLAAAHAAGVIHRDFKPENVLVGNDGRPRVLDFGLARPVELGPARTGSSANMTAAHLVRERSRPLPRDDDPERTPDAEAPTREQADASLDLAPDLALTDPSELGPATFENDALLTRSGTMVGTPAYMSPEQFAGRNVDARSDQFSFCVALHEALYGVRPFVGRSALELALEVQHGRVIKPPPGKDIPSWLRAAILRGLEVKPELRWPSMTALLDAIEQRMQRRRRWPKVVAALALLGLGGALTSLLATPPSGPSVPCESAEAMQAELWSEALPSAIERAFAASQLPYASSSSTRVVQRLARWTERWASERHATCTAGQRHELSDALIDRRQACLARARRSFQSLVEQLEQAEPSVVERAIEASATLPEPERCADLDALSSDAALPPASLAEAVELQRGELAELDALLATGRFAVGHTLAEQARARAEQLDFVPLHAEAELRLALFEARLGRTEQALARLEQALDLADRSGHERLVPAITSALVHLSVYDRPDPQRGRSWARRSLATLDHLGEQGLERALALWMVGNLERIAGELGPAEQHLRAALAIYEADEHPERGAVLNDIANVLDARGDRAGAREVYLRARALVREAFGEGHPRLGHVEFNLARLASSDGRVDEARTHLDAAAAIYAQALGRERRELGDVELARAWIDLQAGQLGAARSHAELARDVLERTLAPDNVDRAEPHVMLGHVALAEDDPSAAVGHYRRALAQQRVALPEGHLALATSQTNLGYALLRAGQLDAAIAELADASARFEAGVDVDAADLRAARTMLAEALLDRTGPGDLQRATHVLAIALASLDATTPPSERLPLLILDARAAMAAGRHAEAKARADEARALVGEGVPLPDPAARGHLDALP